MAEIIKGHQIRNVNLNWLRTPRSPKTHQEIFFFEWFSQNLPQVSIFYEQLILRSDNLVVTTPRGEKRVERVERRPDCIVPRYVNDDIPFFPEEGDPHDFPVVGIELTSFLRQDPRGQERKQPMRELAAAIEMPLAIIFHDEEFDFMNMFYYLKAQEQTSQGTHHKYKNLDLWSVLAQTVEYWMTEYEPSKRTDSAA
jgi:hypothetical protein